MSARWRANQARDRTRDERSRRDSHVFAASTTISVRPSIGMKEACPLIRKPLATASGVNVSVRPYTSGAMATIIAAYGKTYRCGNQMPLTIA